MNFSFRYRSIETGFEVISSRGEDVPAVKYLTEREFPIGDFVWCCASCFLAVAAVALWLDLLNVRRKFFATPV